MVLRRFIAAGIVGALLGGCDVNTGVDPAGTPESVPLLDAYIEPESFQAMERERLTGLRAPVRFFYRGQAYRGWMEAQGAGSRYLPKWSFQIICEEGATLEGLSTFNLSAQVYDRAMVRTAIATRVYSRAGFPVPRSFHVFLRLNGRHRGLYLLTERMEDAFFAARGLPVSELVKVLFAAEFTFAGGSNDLHAFDVRIPDEGSKGGVRDFIHAFDTAAVDNLPGALDPFLDVRRYLLYHAATTILNNVDAFTNNFYLFRPRPGEPYGVLPWDFDKALYMEADVGLAGENEIITKLLRSDTCRGLYYGELRRLLRDVVTVQELAPLIDSVGAHIGDAYRRDPWLGGAGYSLERELQDVRDFLILRRQTLLASLPAD